MSRSNPTEGIRNPSTRWFEWAGGDNGGFVRWYNKDTKENVKAPEPFVFLLLDELSTVKGWHEKSESGIYANEVRDTRQEVLVVKSFNGGELASGLYSDIKDKIVANGGHYVASLYIAYKAAPADPLVIANLHLKGAAAGAWMDFKKAAPTKKTPDGKSLRAYFVDAVKIDGFEQQKKGATSFRVPKFALHPVSEATNLQAGILDAELQGFLTDYLKRPRAEASKPTQPEISPEPDPFETAPAGAFDDFKDDIPY